MADFKISNLVFVWITALLYCFNNLESVTFQKNNSDVVTSYTSCMSISLTSVIANLTVLSILDCVYECTVRQRCKGLNFRRRYGLCQLLREAGELLVTPGCWFVHRQDITSNGLCQQQCTDGQSCLPMDKGCTFKDANNMALHKPASQSSTFRNTNEAGMAVDGIWEISNYSHTNTSVEETAWWEVDLLTPTRVSSLKILNRKSDDHVVKRLHDITVTVGNSSNHSEVCTTYKGPGGYGQLVELSCSPAITGRFVRISKPNNLEKDDNLAMCEVGIY